MEGLQSCLEARLQWVEWQESRHRGPSCLWVLGHLVDGSVLLGMGNSWEVQVFLGGGQWELTWKEVWKKSLLGSPPLSTRAHHPQVSRTPDGLEGENMGFLEGAGAIWSSTPLPMDSGQPPACQAQQQGPAGSGRVPSVCPRAGTTSRQRVSRLPPPRLPGSDSAPWNKQSPTMTADTRHSPPGLPSD